MDELVAQVLAEKARRGVSMYKLAQQTGMSVMTLRGIARTGLTRSLHARRRLWLWLES